jgi:regulator of sirC expression with transglutaminase-like and TPR domain
MTDCQQLLQEVHRGAAFDARLIEPAANRAVLFRMLSNLKMLYLRAADWHRALSALDRMLLLVPDHPSVLRDRGLLFFHLEQTPLALRDLERYQELAPERAGVDTATLAVCELARRRFQALN